MTFEAFDVVVVPFPFTDRATTRRRPALVLSGGRGFDARIGQSVLAMITTAARSDWPLDAPIRNLQAAGLPAPSVVRMKLFTLDHRLILRKAGALDHDDRAAVTGSVRALFAACL